MHAKDLFKVDADPAKTLRDMVRSPVNFVAGSQPLVVLLQEMSSGGSTSPSWSTSSVASAGS